MRKELRTLVIDDDELSRHSIASVFKAEGWNVEEARSSGEPIQVAPRGEWDVVVYDAARDQHNGFEFLKTLTREFPKTRVVLTTSQPSATAALDAAVLGAFDYLPKPLKDPSLLLRRLAQRCEASLEDANLHRSRRNQNTGETLVGSSDSLIEVMKQVGRIAATSLPVLLTGDSGTGKEVVASLLHQRSSRSNRPFVAVNCSAIPATLIESELFGHEKGAFTGADRDRQGLWEEAAGGTILLDEITETSLSFQVKLLRIIQRGEVRRVGSNQVRHLDVRVVAASNRDVVQEVAAGRFRQDLFHRLNAVSITLPSLRERREDIPALIENFERRMSPHRKLRFSPEVLRLFQDYSWPGNIRELEHVVMRCVAMCDGIVLPQDLPEAIRNQRHSPSDQSALVCPGPQREEWPQLASIEATYVAEVLTHTNWNKQATSRILNVDRKTLNRMIKRHQIAGPRRKLNSHKDYRAA
ncbi:MAG TPA: sigma-54 dependent transcriptional regulator [Pyrinomonadaceae bacterium]|nr:sigma-54 dependent transcriptional regulator [Pyrinomonadaceae bacterium]